MGRRELATPRPDRPLLNSMEKAIIQLLEGDPRITNREIADRLDLTMAQVVSRIRRIQQSGVARVVAVLDLDALGQSLAMLAISVRGARSPTWLPTWQGLTMSVGSQVYQVANTT